MMRLFAPFTFLRLAIRRLVAQAGLTLAALSGLVAAATLALSIPLYADAAYSRVLQRTLSQPGLRMRPPFAFMFRYVGAWHDPLEWEAFGPVDAYLSRQGPAALGLPITLTVRHFRTEPLRFYPASEAIYADRRQPLSWLGIGFISDLESHVELLEGRMPITTGPGEPVEVLVSLVRAEEFGLHPGEDYVLFDPDSNEAPIPVRVAGIWRARDPTEAFWFYDPDGLNDLLLTTEETYAGVIAPARKNDTYLALWYIVADGSGVSSDEVAPLLGRIGAVHGRALSLLPKIGLDVSPMDALNEYRRSARQLSISLYTFSVPILGLILAFIGLVAGLSVERRRNEIAVLRSRGASVVQVITLSLVEGALLGASAFALAIPLGREIAALIAHTRTFLEFTSGSRTRINISLTALRVGLAAVGVAIVALLLPTLGAARHTIVTYKLERARALRPPWWRRAWLDVLLLIPAVYGAYLLRRQGGLGGDPFGNPLLIAVPAFFVFSLALLVLRVLPFVMNALAAVLAWFPGVSLLFATRHLARSSRYFTGPLLLLILTLSLAIYTASLAQTLDYNLLHASYYKVGADMHLTELGESTESFQGPGAMAAAPPPTTEGEEEEEPRWLFLPVSEHLKVPGVRAAARVGDYRASTNLGGAFIRGTFRGVDRVDFTKVAYWRRDLAPSSLGALMNALAVRRDGILVPRGLLGQFGLTVGDPLLLDISLFGEGREVQFTIVGTFDLFPRWNPEEGGALFVGDLDYLFESVGGIFPYDVWLSVEDTTSSDQVVEGLQELRLLVLDAEDARSLIAQEQARPQRQGTLGLLSIGFAAAGLLTVLAFLFYALFSFQRRFIELGVLRAMGLSIPQMAALLGWEMILLLGAGTAAGTALGIWASHLFIPYLQVGPALPPFQVVIAWEAVRDFYILFGLLFLMALASLIPMLVRMRIFQAVKLGEVG